MVTNFNFDAPKVLYIPDYHFGPAGLTYSYILKGSKNLTSIWAEPTTSFTSGRFFTASSATLNVVSTNIDVSNSINDTYVYDWYSTTNSGRAEQALDSANVVDINVIF